MALARRFDYDEFVDDFRAACARRGIDPVRGASSYQVVHVAAELRRADAPIDCWWRRHELWLDCPPYRSDTEQEALFRIFTQAYGSLARRFAQTVRLRRGQLSLRELHAQRRQRETRNR